jgi:hypothetical protein
MEDGNIMQEEKPEDQKPLDLESIESDIRSMDHLLTKLEHQAGILPKVDKEGSSECPFARELYSLKEEAEEKVIDHLKNLRMDYKALRKEISRCRKNLQLIQSEVNRIRLDDTLKAYSEAEGSLEFYYKRAIDLKVRLTESMADARKLLDITKVKKWPLGKARKTDDESAPVLYGVRPLQNEGTFRKSNSNILEPDLGKEVDSLMGLGPMPVIDTPGYLLNNETRNDSWTYPVSPISGQAEIVPGLMPPLTQGRF